MSETPANIVKDQVLRQAKQVLKANWIKLSGSGGFTRPAAGLYPYQWNWDAGLIAYGYTHYNIPRAIEELRSLFSGQWDTGFLPHIIFHRSAASEDIKYTPGPDFWQCQTTATGAPSEVLTSGITQPPIHAMVAWHIYKQLHSHDTSQADAFLQEFYPLLFKLHRYFYTQRDPEGWGLITIYHPWESGFDNSPRWDAALQRIKPEYVPDYERVDTNYVDRKFRPTDQDYDRYMYLAAELKKHAYNDKQIYPVHPFKIKDKVLSSILYAATQRLLYLAETLNSDDTVEINQWLRRFKNYALPKLWSKQDKIFYDYDLITNDRIRLKSVSGLLPVMTGVLSEQQVSDISQHLDQANFCGQQACAIALAPSLGIQEESFNHELYWRGPIWINVNWFLWKGFTQYGLAERARHLQVHMINLIAKEGFREYYSPLSGQGLGARDFSWTAALAIDLLEHWSTSTSITDKA